MKYILILLTLTSCYDPKYKCHDGSLYRKRAEGVWVKQVSTCIGDYDESSVR